MTVATGNLQLLLNYFIQLKMKTISFCCLTGSAASKVDLKPGDQLVTMDSISLASINHAEIIKMIQKVIVHYSSVNDDSPVICFLIGFS